TPRDEPVMTAVLPARALMGTPEGSWCGRRPEPTGAGRRAVRPLGWAGARVAELADALDLGSSARGREGSSPFSRTHRPLDEEKPDDPVRTGPPRTDRLQPAQPLPGLLGHPPERDRHRPGAFRPRRPPGRGLGRGGLLPAAARRADRPHHRRGPR